MSVDFSIVKALNILLFFNKKKGFLGTLRSRSLGFWRVMLEKKTKNMVYTDISNHITIVLRSTILSG